MYSHKRRCFWIQGPLYQDGELLICREAFEGDNAKEPEFCREICLSQSLDAGAFFLLAAVSFCHNLARITAGQLKV
jgi:hypothetical protein